MLERVKAMPMPEPDGWAAGGCYYPNTRTKIAMGDIWFVTADRRYNEEQVRAAREQVAAEADERIERLVKALENLMRWFPTDGDLLDAKWPKMDVERAMNAYEGARSVLAEARKA